MYLCIKHLLSVPELVNHGFQKIGQQKDIESAGQQVASLSEFAKAKDGEIIFGEVNGMRVGD